MKHIHNKTLLGASLALAMTFATCLPTAIAAENEPMKPASGPTTPAASYPKLDEDSESANAKMMEHCKDMGKKKDKMAVDMKIQDAELADQVAKMNSASDDKKMDMMTAIVTRMVEQRAATNVRMAKMGGEMMDHMMNHMKMDKESISNCPMNKEMEDKKGN